MDSVSGSVAAASVTVVEVTVVETVVEDVTVAETKAAVLVLVIDDETDVTGFIFVSFARDVTTSAETFIEDGLVFPAGFSLFFLEP